jgi:hypothetical protein
MHDSWNYALRQAAGEYIILLGDDDAILPTALTDIDFILRQTSSPILRWPVAFYFWPGTSPDLENSLTLPITEPSQTVNGRKIVEGVLHKKTDRYLLPMLYNSAIHRDLLYQLTAKTGGPLTSHNPDIFSGVSLAAIKGFYLSTSRIMTICGVSPKSNGLNFMSEKPDMSSANDYFRLLTESGINWPNNLPRYLPSDTPAIHEAFEHAAAAIPEVATIKKPGKKALFRLFLQDLLNSGRLGDQNLRDELLAAAAHAGIGQWFKNELRKGHLLSKVNSASPSTRRDFGFHNSRLRIDASKFAVENVQQAAAFVSLLCGYSSAPPSTDFPMSRSPLARTFIRAIQKIIPTHLN